MLIIKIKGGYSNFKGGQTTMELNTTGEIKIENIYKGEKREFKDHININEKFEKMISNLMPLFNNWKYGKRKGVPDEALYEIEIIDTRRKDAIVKFVIWNNELKSAPEIGEMVKYLKDLVKELTKQKVIL